MSVNIVFRRMKQGLSAFIIVTLACLMGCTHSSDRNTIRIGTIDGPETKLVEIAREVAKKRFDLNLKIVTFSDYSLPNIALADGSIDANIFQHQPYLDEATKQRLFDFSVLGKTFIYPMGVYSQKHSNIKMLAERAIFAIPNDPSNEARALLLLEHAGLIKLKPGITTSATIIDIQDNPKHFIFKELDAAELPRLLKDVDCAVINSNYAIPAGLFPSKHALLRENKASLYANLIVIRSMDKDDPRFKPLLFALQSKEVLAAAKDIFKGEAIAAW